MLLLVKTACGIQLLYITGDATLNKMAFRLRLANQISRMMFGGSRCAGGAPIIELSPHFASFELAVECLAMLLSDNAMQNNSIFTLDFTEVRE
jgi:hypothetical protein